MSSHGPEHLEVRLPLIQSLISAGWNADQIVWKPEWRVPKTPSEASRREARQRFDGFPVDLVIFDDPRFAGDPDHVLAIFETKRPDELTGITQLKIYLNMEPAARVGVWTNGRSTTRVYRSADGKFEVEKGASLPSPNETFLHAGKSPLRWADLSEPTAKKLKDTLQRVLDLIVARDPVSTRRDDQLNQLCNLLLAKLESDKLAKADPKRPAIFQFWEDEAHTSANIRSFFQTLRGTHADLFGPDESGSIGFSDHTISVVAYELGSLRLFDTPMDVMSHAFQVFRAATLKSEEGQYFTPYPVIRSVVQLMEVHPSDVMIDPACGTGGFLLEAFASLRERFPSMDSGDVKQWAQRRLFGIDKDRVNVKLTKAMMLIAGDGSTHTFRADSLSTSEWHKDYPYAASTVKDGSFTLVLTNPPFGERLTYSARDARLSGYTVSHKPKTPTDRNTSFDPHQHVDREVGIIFLERCWQLLAPGGRLGIILPETYFFSKSYMWLQSWIESHFHSRGVVNIPMEAFQGFCRAKTNFYIFEKR